MKRSWPCLPQTADETPDETTGETTSHPTKQPENGCQVVGYSHLTRLANALHSHSAKSPKDGDISRWLTPTKSLVNDNQVAGYRPRTCPLLIFALPPPDKLQ